MQAPKESVIDLIRETILMTTIDEACYSGVISKESIGIINHSDVYVSQSQTKDFIFSQKNSQPISIMRKETLVVDDGFEYKNSKQNKEKIEINHEQKTQLWIERENKKYHKLRSPKKSHDIDENFDKAQMKNGLLVLRALTKSYIIKKAQRKLIKPQDQSKYRITTFEDDYRISPQEGNSTQITISPCSTLSTQSMNQMALSLKSLSKEISKHSPSLFRKNSKKFKQKQKRMRSSQFKICAMKCQEIRLFEQGSDKARCQTDVTQNQQLGNTQRSPQQFNKYKKRRTISNPRAQKKIAISSKLDNSLHFDTFELFLCEQ